MKNFLRLLEFVIFQSIWKGIEKMISTDTLKFISDNLIYWTYIVGFLVLLCIMIASYIKTKHSSKRFAFNITEKIVSKILPNKIQRQELSIEIDRNLKLLHDFWNEYQGYSDEPLSLSEAFRRTQQVVVSTTENSITTDSVDSIEHDIDFPQWYRKEFDGPTSLYSLSTKEKQDVRQFYDNLIQITSKYNKIRKLGNKVAERTNLKEKLESLITKVLEQGNPLKPIS